MDTTTTVTLPEPAPLDGQGRLDAIALVNASRRHDLDDIATAIAGADTVLAATAMLGTEILNISVMPDRRERELHAWTLPDGTTWYVLVTTLVDMGGPEVTQDVVVTEYDLTRPGVLAAVIELTGHSVCAPDRATSQWTGPTQARILHGAPGQDGRLAEFNDQLRDQQLAWVNTLHRLRSLDDRPLPPPVAGWRNL